MLTAHNGSGGPPGIRFMIIINTKKTKLNIIVLKEGPPGKHRKVEVGSYNQLGNETSGGCSSSFLPFLGGCSPVGWKQFCLQWHEQLN